MNRSFRWVAAIIAAALCGALIMLAILRPAAKDKDEEAAAPAPSRVAASGGETAVTLDVATQQKIGLVTAPLAASRQAGDLQLFGIVVDVQELAAIEKQLATARADADQARAKSAYDRAELARLRTLYRDARIVSQRDVQQAAAAVAIDDAAVTSATAAINAASSNAVQRFGTVLAEAIASRSALYQDLVSMRQMLVEITFPPGTTAPQTVRLTAADGSVVPAKLLSAAPRVDPRLQGASDFYVAAGGKLAAGMNVIAHLPDASAAAGVIVPENAVVSFEGRSWIFVRGDATHFARREVSIANPLPGGFFVAGIPAGTEVVTTGAQQLLSEEMRAGLHAD